MLVGVTVAGGVLTVLGTPDALANSHSALLSAGLLLLVMGGWAVSLCLHEFGHALVAYRSGDESVRQRGYLSLDIRRYTDIGLSLVLPLVFLLLGGIPLPGGAVWIQQGAIRSRWLRSLVSLAGPLVNLALGVVLLVVVRMVPLPVGLAVGLSALAFYQVLAFLLNILPIPGLDGWGVVEPFVAPRGINPTLRTWAPLAFFVLLITFQPVSQLFFGVAVSLFEWLGGNPRAYAIGDQEMRFWEWARW